MICEDYVNIETAKLLKEKGFDWNCETKRFYDQESPDGVCVPTLQTAMKWLREAKHYYIQVSIQNDGTYIGYIYRTDGFPYVGWDKRRVKETPEEACEAAVKYCLENLI